MNGWVKVKTKVAAKNDLYPSGHAPEDWQGDEIQCPAEFPAGTTGFVDPDYKEAGIAIVGIFHRDDPETGPRTGNIILAPDQVEVIG